MTFLGHDVDRDGLHINRDKVSSVNAWPTPKNTKEVQSFLGFAQYFKKKKKKFSKIALPLTNLTKHSEKFKWELSEQKSFDQLK